MTDIRVRCTRCQHEHMESQRPATPVFRGMGRLEMFDRGCPKCDCRTYFDLTPMVAWCWASGLIELGAEMPASNADGGGAILIARGPKAFLRGTVEVLARHGRGKSRGLLLVPGVPEADDEQAKGDALAHWLEWCARGNGKRHRSGVEFSKERHATEPT